MLKKIRVKPFTSLAKKSKTSIQEFDHRQFLLVKGSSEDGLSPAKTPTGFFAVYVGKERERERFVVPTNFLSHPLFKILLEKSYDEFGFEQQNGIIVPCSVSTFQQIVNAVESNHGKFDMKKLFEEFV